MTAPLSYNTRTVFQITALVPVLCLSGGRGIRHKFEDLKNIPHPQVQSTFSFNIILPNKQKQQLRMSGEPRDVEIITQISSASTSRQNM